MTQCDKCGEFYESPAWPWCPHGETTLQIQRDEIDITVHNMGATPLRFRSRQAWKDEIKARGLVNAVRHYDGDRHVKRMV